MHNKVPKDYSLGINLSYALFLKKELEELPENQGHLYDNTGKSVEQEVVEVMEFMKEIAEITNQ